MKLLEGSKFDISSVFQTHLRLSLPSLSPDDRNRSCHRNVVLDDEQIAEMQELSDALCVSSVNATSVYKVVRHWKFREAITLNP
jgi:hypothetical protein